MRKLLLRWARRVMAGRPPDQVLRRSGDTVYMERWYIWRTRWTCLYLHRFLSDDGAQSPHDHPWWSLSYTLNGVLNEEVFTPDVVCTRRRTIHAGDLVFRRATHLHRIDISSGVPCVTLFLTGPRRRTWGFATRQGWIEHDSVEYWTLLKNGEL